MKSNFEETEVFPTSSTIGPREWGEETLLALVSEKFTVKRLQMKAGSKGGMQFHRLKDEVAILISGELLVRYDLGDGLIREKVLSSGQVVHFPPGLVHQEEAITECEIIEASTPHFNDRVRVEDQYGISESGGLPTTTLDEIEAR